MKKNTRFPIYQLLVAALIFCAFPAFGQYEDAKHGIAVRWNFINHHFPFHSRLFAKDIHTFGAEVVYQYHLHPNFNLAIPLQYSNADYYESNGINTDRSTNNFQSVDALIHAKFFREPALLSPYALAGIGMNLEGFENPSAHIPMGLGVNIRLNKHIYLSLQSEYRHSFKDLRSYLKHGLGLFLIFNPRNWNKDTLEVSGPDTDGDGILDANDKCPQVAGLAMYSGCPDTDGDTVPDYKDQCPETAGPRDNGGCPYNDNDEDNDGIVDSEDRCPNIPGSVQMGGCPDYDGDGIPESDDDCPQVFGLAKFRGCPDADNDGIPEPTDKCPDEVGPADNFGCPVIEIGDQEILDAAMQAVEFETSKALLKDASFPILNDIVAIMAKYPSYHLEISGHTDSVGDSASNQVLSEKRAKSCYEYLIKKGVAPNRMQYKGFGESQPIADNINMAGRQKNRRVEFKVFLK